MQRILIILGSSVSALGVLVVGLMLAGSSVAAALTVMGLFAAMAIGVIVLIVRHEQRQEPRPAAPKVEEESRS